MSDAAFEDGLPEKLTVTEFLRYHLPSFTRLADPAQHPIVQEAIDTVYSMFTGVATIWDNHTPQVWYDKTITVYRLLTAWYIADQYPMYTNGVPGTGGIPILRKKVGPVDITFEQLNKAGKKDYLDLLSPLKSNNFGYKAYMMITSSSKRALLRMQNRV